jgi:hypothetical protein
MRHESVLGLISHLGFAAFGAVMVYHGIKRSSQYQSLPMRLRRQPAVPMTTTHRSLFVGLGALLIVVSVLLASGVIH